VKKHAALMNAGATFAQQFQLTSGIARHSRADGATYERRHRCGDRCQLDRHRPRRATAAATSGETVNLGSGRLLAESLAKQEAIAPQLGTTLPGAAKPIVVTAESEIGGVKLFDTNQGARPMTAAEANKPTLIAGEVNAGQPNGSMGSAHAEVAVIQRAYDAGLTKGQDMTIVVRGIEEVCTYCRSNLVEMAEAAGLKSLTVVDTVSGKVLSWTVGDTRFLVKGLH
jgi:hypothetical protein